MFDCRAYLVAPFRYLLHRLYGVERACVKPDWVALPVIGGEPLE